MRIARSIPAAAGLVALAGLALAAPAAAEETTCRGTIGAATVDNLRVPQDGTCTLNRTVVKGTVKVERAATLNARGVRLTLRVRACQLPGRGPLRLSELLVPLSFTTVVQGRPVGAHLVERWRTCAFV